MENAAITSSSPDSSLRVYVVEDSAPVRERLQEMVESIAGARCAGSAETARAAIAGIRETSPDAVILDIRLPDGTGFDVMRALKNHQPSPVFYVLSSFALEPYRRLAMKLGATAFLDKVTQLETIRELIANHASRKPMPAH
ncbi:MAG TPA: response regulator [Burkholderiales bacterium]